MLHRCQRGDYVLKSFLMKYTNVASPAYQLSAGTKRLNNTNVKVWEKHDQRIEKEVLMTDFHLWQRK